MRVSAEYFDGEPYEPLNLNQEQWGVVSAPAQAAASRMGTVADKIVKQAKAQAAQEEARES